jgi:hypothetical protein
LFDVIFLYPAAVRSSYEPADSAPSRSAPLDAMPARVGAGREEDGGIRTGRGPLSL